MLTPIVTHVILSLILRKVIKTFSYNFTTIKKHINPFIILYVFITPTVKSIWTNCVYSHVLYTYIKSHKPRGNN